MKFFLCWFISIQLSQYPEKITGILQNEVSLKQQGLQMAETEENEKTIDTTEIVCDIVKQLKVNEILSDWNCDDATTLQKICTWKGISCDESGVLTHLRLTNLGLMGSIPESICRLQSLRVLDLSFNQLSSSIPTTIGNMTAVWYLNLRANKLTSSIPTSIGKLMLHKLIFLDLSYNRLSSSIPSTIGHLTRLEILFLNDNKLTSSIPTSIGLLTRLKLLNLLRN